MADSKLSGLPEATVPHSDDLLLVSTSPSTNPTSQKMSLATLFGAVPGNVTLVTGGIAAAANSSFTGVTASSLKVSGNRLNISTSHAPVTSAGATGDKAGDVCWDSSYVYICLANYTDGLSPIWKRTALTTF